MDPVKPKGEHDELARMLDELGRREADERRAADELEDAPGLRRVERVLEDVWATPRPSTKRRTWPFVVGALAVAAVVLAIFFSKREEAPRVDGPSGQALGEGDLVIHRPPSPPGEYPDRVTWSGSKGLVYALRIAASEDGAPERELLSKGGIIGLEYVFPAEVTRTWPDEIRIVLSAKTRGGDPVPPVESSWKRSR